MNNKQQGWVDYFNATRYHSITECTDTLDEYADRMWVRKSDEIEIFPIVWNEFEHRTCDYQIYFVPVNEDEVEIASIFATLKDTFKNPILTLCEEWINHSKLTHLQGETAYEQEIVMGKMQFGIDNMELEELIADAC